MSYQGKLLKNTAIIALGKISTQILSYYIITSIHCKDGYRGIWFL